MIILCLFSIPGGGSLAPSPRHMSHRDSASTPTPHPHLPTSPHWLPRQPGQHPSPYWLGTPYGLSPHAPPPPSPLHHGGLDLPPGHGHLPLQAPPGLQLARDPATGQLVLIPQSPSPSEMSNLGKLMLILVRVIKVNCLLLMLSL